MSSGWVLYPVSIILLVFAFIFDSSTNSFLYIEKVGSLIAVFGVLLSIKHRLLTAFSSYINYDLNINGDGFGFFRNEISPNEVKIVKSKAIEEANGVWMILIGTLLSVLSFWQAIFNFIANKCS